MDSSPPSPYPKNPGLPWVPIVVGYYYYGFSPIFHVFPYISETTSDRKHRFGFYIKKYLYKKRVVLYMTLNLNNIILSLQQLSTIY